MQKEEARLRDLGGYSGPCSVRGYVATVTQNPVGLDRVCKEHAGVRISVARSVAPKVPSIRELILQLNRKQQPNELPPHQRPFVKPVRKSINNLTPRPLEQPENRHSFPLVMPSRELMIQIGESASSPSPSNKGQSPTMLPPTHRAKLPWRLTNNSSQPHPVGLGGLMKIRHMTSSTDNSEVQNDSSFIDKFDDRWFLDRDLDKSSSQENVNQHDTLTDGVLICSSMQQHKASIPDAMITGRANLVAPSSIKRSPPLSSTLSSTHFLANGLQQSKLTHRPNATEPDPEYQDPMSGAPLPFHQRVINLSSLESETIRVERLKALKKKNKGYCRQD